MTTNDWEVYWRNKNNREWWTRPQPEILEFIKSQNPKQRPDVLDLGCGLGRYAIAFAEAGFSVTAVDSSETAIVYLREWAERLNLSIRTKICDIFKQTFQNGSYDIVLSYNVIHHGYREQFSQAIGYVRTLLRSEGLFYFTCPTRQDGKYGYGEQVAPHTFLCTKSIHPGNIHYFADETDFDELLAGFKFLSRKKKEEYWDNNGVRQFSSHWHILAVVDK